MLTFLLAPNCRPKLQQIVNSDLTAQRFERTVKVYQKKQLDWTGVVVTVVKPSRRRGEKLNQVSRRSLGFVPAATKPQAVVQSAVRPTVTRKFQGVTIQSKL